MMRQATTARAFLERLHPWIGRAVHSRWTTSRMTYRLELESILLALTGERGHVPPKLSLRVQGLLAKLHREWFPPTWRRSPTYDEIVADFRWWLTMAERWSVPPPRATRAKRKPAGKPSGQPKRLLHLLGLPPETTHVEFIAAWRRFLKRNHPDLNPDQTPEERRRFADAVALWRRGGTRRQGAA
jgi:hypothetical protein